MEECSKRTPIIQQLQMSMLTQTQVQEIQHEIYSQVLGVSRLFRMMGVFVEREGSERSGREDLLCSELLNETLWDPPNKQTAR